MGRTSASTWIGAPLGSARDQGRRLVAVTLQFFGTAGYRIVTGDGKSVLIDPYLDFSAASPLVGRQRS